MDMVRSLLCFVIAFTGFSTPGLASEGDYVLGPGDVVSVQVYNDTSLSGEHTIDESCQVDLTFVQVAVCGLTPAETAREIRNALTPGYLLHPEVSVRITRYGSQKVEVTGAVSNPGILALEGTTTLSEIITRAGGPAQENVVEALLISPEGNTREYQLDQLAGTSVVVQGGDTVVLKQGRFVTVLGEVNREGTVPFRTGLTVTAALSEAGGPTISAVKRRVRVVRATGETLTVNIRKINEGKESDLALLPDDKVVLRRTAL